MSSRRRPHGTRLNLATGYAPYVPRILLHLVAIEALRRRTGDDGPPFRWDAERRVLLRADLDAAFLHVYGLNLNPWISDFVPSRG